MTKSTLTTRKNIFLVLLITGIILGFWAAVTPQSHAQENPTLTPVSLPPSEAPQPAEPATSVITPTATTVPVSASVEPAANTPQFVETVNFNQLDVLQNVAVSDDTVFVAQAEQVGRTFQLRFRTPINWELLEGAQLQLDLERIVSEPTVISGTIDALRSKRYVDVSFNQTFLTRILLDQSGALKVTLPITTAALIPPRSDRNHDLTLALDYGNCRLNQDVALVVRPESSFILPYRVIPPSIDLTQLPLPIAQRSAVITDTVLLVVPDAPSAKELQAALTVSAGFGLMSRGEKFDLSVISANQFTPTAALGHHLIFVGKPAAFPMLDAVTLPAPVADDGFAVTGINPDDGVIQMALSPWDQTKVVLVFGGASDEAVVKAGQALSTGQVRPGDRPDLALVAEIQNENPFLDPDVIDHSFQDLGYDLQKLTRTDANTSYRFYVPPGYLTTDEAFVDLVFNHSALLDFLQSGLTVKVNNQIIGNERLSASTTRANTARLSIPRTTIQPGLNSISVEAVLVPYDPCVNPNIESTWLNIWPESMLHLPLLPIPQEVEGSIYNLGDYRDPFALDPTLGSTAFVVPVDDVSAWQVASQLTFDFGKQGNMPIANFALAFGNAVPAEIRNAFHLMIVGKPSTLPIIDELADVLPAPFMPGTDTAIEQGMRVIYHFPEGTSLGYLETTSSPWNPGRTILTVLGSTDQGVQWAGNALLTQRGSLENNFAVVKAEQIVLADINLNSVAMGSVITPTATSTTSPLLTSAQVAQATATAEANVVVVTPVTAQPPTATPFPYTEKPVLLEPVQPQPTWILPVLGISVLLMVVIIVWVTISFFRQRKL
jgi:hypothetical protein